MLTNSPETEQSVIIKVYEPELYGYGACFGSTLRLIIHRFYILQYTYLQRFI